MQREAPQSLTDSQCGGGAPMTGARETLSYCRSEENTPELWDAGDAVNCFKQNFPPIAALCFLSFSPHQPRLRSGATEADSPQTSSVLELYSHQDPGPGCQG